MSNATHEGLSAAIAEMPVFNTHEHAWKSFSGPAAIEFDLPYFLSSDYISGDLVTAGFLPDGTHPDLLTEPPAYLTDPRLPDEADSAWERLRPYLDRVRNTSYFRYRLRGAKEMFDVSEQDIFSDRWREASDKIRAYSRANKGRGAALCSRMGVAATVLDANLGPGRIPEGDYGDHRIVHVARMDAFIHGARGLAETMAEHSTGHLDAWLACFDKVFQASLDAGAAGFKSGLAYNRPIEYGEPSWEQAARVFRRGVMEASVGEQAAFQDFMMNHLCQRCVEADVPMQIHTGIQAGVRQVLEDARPTLLSSLFRRHPDLRVDLFHGGYPWCVEAGLMAKYFPNVHVNGCWLSHISPSAYREALRSWVQTVPMTKIFAFGGDHTLLELSQGALLEAKDLISDALGSLVDEGYFGIDVAVETAKRILHDNASDFWRL